MECPYHQQEDLGDRKADLTSTNPKSFRKTSKFRFQNVFSLFFNPISGLVLFNMLDIFMLTFFNFLAATWGHEQSKKVREPIPLRWARVWSVSD